FSKESLPLGDRQGAAKAGTPLLGPANAGCPGLSVVDRREAGLLSVPGAARRPPPLLHLRRRAAAARGGRVLSLGRLPAPRRLRADRDLPRDFRQYARSASAWHGGPRHPMRLCADRWGRRGA